SYYYLAVGALKRWHPGAGGVIANPRQNTAAEHTDWKYYREVRLNTATRRRYGGWTVDTAQFRQQRARILEFVRRLLSATAARPAKLSCFGLHEWAMAYKSDKHGIRHSTVPLRLGAQGTNEVVETHNISCSHFDAFRFYAPEARGMNRL